MKKSVLVGCGVIMAALILSWCGDDRRCVDSQGNVVDDKYCQEANKQGTAGGHGGFHWYYGGTGHSIGSRASGGSFTPVSRGGFGRLASFHGFGHS